MVFNDLKLTEFLMVVNVLITIVMLYITLKRFMGDKTHYYKIEENLMKIAQKVEK